MFLRADALFFRARLARPSLEKHNILVRSSNILFQRCPIMIVLNEVDKILSHERDSILKFLDNSTKENTLIATLHVYIDKCPLFSFKCLSVSMEIIAMEDSLT